MLLQVLRSIEIKMDRYRNKHETEHSKMKLMNNSLLKKIKKKDEYIIKKKYILITIFTRKAFVEY
jgi:hypothetical protein